MNTANKMTGWMVIALVVVGIFSLAAAVLSVFNEFNYVGAGLCLLASGYAFGTILKTYSQ